MVDLTAAMNTAGDRLAEIEAAVTEVSSSFDVTELQGLPIESILLDPVGEVVQRLRSSVDA